MAVGLSWAVWMVLEAVGHIGDLSGCVCVGWIIMWESIGYVLRCADNGEQSLIVLLIREPLCLRVLQSIVCSFIDKGTGIIRISADVYKIPRNLN